MLSDLCLMSVNATHLADGLLGVADSRAADRAGAIVAAATDELRNRNANPSASGRLLASAAAVVNDVAEQCSGTTPVPTADESDAILVQELTPNLLGLPDDADLTLYVDVFRRYDRYFGTRRVARLTAEQQQSQFATTLAAVLADLPNCMIDSHEAIAILEAAACLLPIGDKEAATEPTESPVSDPSSCLNTTDVFDESLRRWKLGHHLFNIFTAHATRALIASVGCTEPSVCSKFFVRATTLLRGTTASMWYAESFPPGLYVSHIRPTMIEASGSGSGFSGTDNLEFHQFKTAVRDAFHHLTKEFGDSDEWPGDLWSSTYAFADMRQLDLEHHTIIADRVVGSGQPSLARLRAKTMKGTLGDQSAVEMLRSLVDSARSFKDNL